MSKEKEKAVIKEFEVTMFDHGRITIDKRLREKHNLGRGSRLRMSLLKVLDRDEKLPKLRGKLKKDKKEK